MNVRNFCIALSLLTALSLSPTAHAKVDTTKTAVIIVDMQGGFYDRGGVRGMPGLEALVAQQQKLIAWAVKEDVPVIFFEYEDYGATNNRLTDPLKGHRHEIITKMTDGAFNWDVSRLPTMEALGKWGVTNLIMSGINGDACVASTTEGALENGYSVITSSDIVGNLNYNPPIYPNATWFSIKHENFKIAKNLDEIIY